MHDWDLSSLAKVFNRVKREHLASPRLQKALASAFLVFEAVDAAYFNSPEDLLEGVNLLDGTDCVDVLLRSPKTAYWLGSYVFEGGENNEGEFPLPDGLMRVVGEDPKYAYLWGHDFHKYRSRKWKTGSTAYRSLCKSAEYGARYAVDVKEMPFLDFEPAIVKDPDPTWAQWYDFKLGTNLSEEWNRLHPDLPQIDLDSLNADVVELG